MKPAAIKFRACADQTRIVIDISVVTPVHGGGVGWESDEAKRHVRHVDQVTPIRAASIRGQLRFWWRATTGCCLGSIEQMRERESQIWGAASRPGKVRSNIEQAIQVAPQSIFVSSPGKQRGDGASAKFNPSPAHNGLRELAYGAFALQPKGNQATKLPDGLLSGLNGKARIQLTLPNEYADEVRLALDAWLLFGGIGGRTRRGFGALSGESSVAPKQLLERLTERRTLQLVSSLHGARLVVGASRHKNAVEAAKSGLGALMDFRQGPEVGRNPPAQEPNNGKPAGRSRWPEAEAIRKVTNRSSPRHREALVGVDKFPRALFGMPILFHFQDEKAGEPKETTLKPRDFDRMASPLILRPYRDADGWRALALVLRVPGAETIPVVLKRESNVLGVPTSLTQEDANKIRPLDAQRDALSAFLAYFAKSC